MKNDVFCRQSKSSPVTDHCSQLEKMLLSLLKADYYHNAFQLDKL